MYFTADPESIAQLVVHPKLAVRYFAGYAGWGPGQLEQEISSGAWHVVPAAFDQVFQTDESLWESLAARQRRPEWLFDALGIRHIPPEPSMN